VHTQTGLRLFGGNTNSHLKNDPSLGVALSKTGRHEVRFAFDRLPLSTGKYYVIAAVHDHRIETTIDIRPDAATFDVIDQGDPTNFDKDVFPAEARAATLHLS
jgi:hypothetical protein